MLAQEASHRSKIRALEFGREKSKGNAPGGGEREWKGPPRGRPPNVYGF